MKMWDSNDWLKLVAVIGLAAALIYLLERPEIKRLGQLSLPEDYAKQAIRDWEEVLRGK
jgi:hypothetical protein